MKDEAAVDATAQGAAVLVVPPGGGRAVRRRFGEQTVIKVAQEATRGAYAVRENTAPAGFSRVPLHLHREAEEAFYVLEGELTVYRAAGAAAALETLVAPAGAYVLIPRGTVHAFANRGAAPVRWLTLISPAWVSGWVEEESDLLQATRGGEPDTGALAAIAEKYGLEVVGPPPEPG